MKLSKVPLHELIEEPISGEWGDEGSVVKVIRNTNFTNEGILDLTDIAYRKIEQKKIESKKLKYGDIIIEKSGGSPKQPVGRVVYFNIENDIFLCSNFTSVIRKKGDLNSRYLFWFLFSNHLNKNTLRYQNKTTGIINLQLYRYINELQIPFPGISTQQRIVSTLDEADALRKADAQLITKYDDLLQASFIKLFGTTNEMVKRFPSKKLDLVSEVVSGVAKNTKAYRDGFIEVPYMRVANVQDGHINLDEIKTIKVSKQDFDKYLLQKDDILLTEGGDPDKLGRGAVWHDEISPCIHQNHIFRVRANKNELNPAYLSFLIGSGYGKRYFLKAAKQTTGIASINMTQLKSFDVIIPPLALQNKFAEITTAIQEQRSIAQQQQQQSENLFQSLLQRAFKGEL